MMKSSFIRTAWYLQQRHLRTVARSKIIQTKFLQSFVSKYRKPLQVATGGTLMAGLWSTLMGEKKEAYNEGPKAIIIGADASFKHGNYEDCYKLLEQFESKTEDPEILWRLTRVLIELSKNEKHHDKKQHYLKKAIELGDKAIKNEGPFGNASVHKWYAIAIKTLGEIEGDKFKQTYAVKVHLERALELSPFDSKVYYELGVWHFQAADYPSYKRWYKAIMFSPPPSSTYEDALRFFEKAEAAEPGLYHKANFYYMGETFERMGQKDKALIAYKKAFAVPVATREDMSFHVKVEEKLIKKYNQKIAELPTGNDAIMALSR